MRILVVAILIAAIRPGIAIAQPTSRPIAGGWTLHERIGTISGLEDVACGPTRAAARSWYGDVAVFDGHAWTALPRDRQESRYGRTLAVAPDGEIFLEANGGIARFDGSRWTQHAIASWEGDVDAQIVAPAAREAYYVGRGRIARWDGSAITAYDAGTYRQLSAVAVIGRTVMVGGQGGTILRHDGSAWSRDATGIGGWVHGLVAFAADDVWAWADGASWREPVVIHWDGRAWTRRDPALGSAVTAIGGTATDVFATGDFGVARWSGSAWVVVLTSAELGPGSHTPHGVCATATHLIVGDRAGRAITRPL